MTQQYYIGGSLPLDHGTYIRRQADEDLYSALQAGEFCYVLNSRQMGKSSLRVRTMARLQTENVACVAIQMTDLIEEGMTAEQWYAGVINSMVIDLQLGDRFDDAAWWDSNSRLSVVQRFSKFIDEILLELIAQPIVIFIDEIDRILSLSFSLNGFFAVIRECYNKRADRPAYNRLTFSLIGVATPSDLIQDKRSTPFNIGQAIELTGFQLHEAEPLIQGLAGAAARPDVLLQEILNWTGGQPFLTQKLCRLVQNAVRADGAAVNGQVRSPHISAGQEANWIQNLVQQCILTNWESQDDPEHLRTIRDRLLRNEQRAGRWIGLYQQILQEGGLNADQSAEQIELRLSGLVVERQGLLQVYNPTYAAIFNQEWVNTALANLRPYAEAIDTWLQSNRQDQSRLLRGNALIEAKQWANDKDLSRDDYLFLNASQELVTQESEQARQLLENANHTLEDANRQANQRITAANRRLQIGSTVLIGTIVLASLTGISLVNARAEKTQIEQAVEQANQNLEQTNQKLTQATQAQQTARERMNAAGQAERRAKADLTTARQRQGRIEQESRRRIAAANKQVAAAAVAAAQARQEQQQATRAAVQAQALAARAQAAETVASLDQRIASEGATLERLGIALLRRPDSQLRGLDALLDSLEMGNRLRRLLQIKSAPTSTTSLDNYPASSPMLALRTAVNSVIEQNNFQTQGEYAQLSPNGQRLVTSSSSDRKSRLYDLAGTQIAQLEGEFSGFSEDGQRLVTYSSSDRKSRLYDLAGTQIAQLEGVFRGFSEDGQRLVTYSSSDRKSRLYDLAGTQIAQFEGWFRGFSEDGQRLVTTLLDQDISRVYGLSGILLAEFSGAVFVSNNRGFLSNSLGFTPDGQHLLTRSSDGYIHLWRLDHGLDDLLERGCNLAQEYLRNHPDETRAQFCLSNYEGS